MVALSGYSSDGRRSAGTLCVLTGAQQHWAAGTWWTVGGHRAYIPQAFSPHRVCTWQAFSRHTVCIQQAQSVHSVSIQQEFSRHTGYTQQTLSRHVVGIQQVLSRHWTVTSLKAGLSPVHSGIG